MIKINKIKILLLIVGLLLVFNLGAISASAGVLNEAFTRLQVVNQSSKLPDAQNPAFIAGLIIQYLLGLLGIIFVVLIIYGGFLWMTAGGNDEQINKARKIITNSTIGLLIVILSYAIALFIVNIIIRATTTPPL